MWATCVRNGVGHRFERATFQVCETGTWMLHRCPQRRQRYSTAPFARERNGTSHVHSQTGELERIAYPHRWLVIQTEDHNA